MLAIIIKTGTKEKNAIELAQEILNLGKNKEDLSFVKKHFEEETDPMFNGDFIAGINTPQGPATYHIKLEYWDLFNIIENAVP